MLSWGSREKAAHDPLVPGFQKMAPVTLPDPLEKKKAQERAGLLPLWAKVSRGGHILSDGKERWSTWEAKVNKTLNPSAACP